MRDEAGKYSIRYISDFGSDVCVIPQLVYHGSSCVKLVENIIVLDDDGICVFFDGVEQRKLWEEKE